MGGVCAVGKRDSEKAECVQCLWEIVSTSGCKQPSLVQLWLAHNIILCSPVAGGD